MNAPWDSLVVPTATVTSLGTSLDRQLIALREEEKLARDVYSALYATWGEPVFQYTAAAEGLHLASAKLLLDWYQLEDPVGTSPPGLFSDEKLQTAYAQLVLRGAASLREAYEVGMVVEQRLIAVLRSLTGRDRPRDVDLVAQTLLTSAQSHVANLMSFVNRHPGLRRYVGDPAA